MTKALLVRLGDLREDPALQVGDRGARKILVTKIYPEREREADVVSWKPPLDFEKCPVQVMPSTEIAVFTNVAPQDRHYHLRGTEIYTVLEGEMVIDIEGEDHIMSAGDMLVVNPGVVRQVKPEGTRFICRVVTVDSGGISDKYVV